MDKKIDKMVQTSNPDDNGGEQILLITEFYDNGDAHLGLDKAVFTNQEIILQSYCNSASIKLDGAQLNSKTLFRLAEEMLIQEIRVKEMLKE